VVRGDLEQLGRVVQPMDLVEHDALAARLLQEGLGI
jgi:hypothetical protein